MSEYQYVAFQAVDRPLNDKQLQFAQRQSSRADVSLWSLSVECHYSSFRGKVHELLRSGYDVYLQYTNYGDREVKLRLPQGLPADKITRRHAAHLGKKYPTLNHLKSSLRKRGLLE